MSPLTLIEDGYESFNFILFLPKKINLKIQTSGLCSFKIVTHITID